MNNGKTECMSPSESDWLDQHGWIGHGVYGDPQSPTGMNWHTHGFEVIGHLNIQFVFAPPKLCEELAARIYQAIIGGRKFCEGEHVSGIVKNFDVTFIKVK